MFSGTSAGITGSIRGKPTSWIPVTDDASDPTEWPN
ncbi:unannotated protein [freshwater metagenome]|uniref:Unannotated protein n=1 Tax=freshwater metagenome TaxID=449393 RepID=A0A6J7RWM1_9ZZZZ